MLEKLQEKYYFQFNKTETNQLELQQTINRYSMSTKNIDTDKFIICLPNKIARVSKYHANICIKEILCDDKEIPSFLLFIARMSERSVIFDIEVLGNKPMLRVSQLLNFDIQIINYDTTNMLNYQFITCATDSFYDRFIVSNEIKKHLSAWNLFTFSDIYRKTHGLDAIDSNHSMENGGIDKDKIIVI